MIERDRVWWCWWKDKREGIAYPAPWIACGFSRHAMDVREGVYERGRVRYREGAFDEDAKGMPMFYLAAAPNAFPGRQWGEGILPVKVDLDLAARIGLRPPDWRDDLPEDRAPTIRDVAEARSALLSDSLDPNSSSSPA